MKKNNDVQRSVPLYNKTIFHYKFPCFEGPFVLNISDVVLQTGNITVKYEGPITFSIFFIQRFNFSTQNIIWDILYIENLVVHLSSLHFLLCEYRVGLPITGHLRNFFEYL